MITNKEFLNRLAQRRTPSIPELIDENHSLRAKNRVAYTGLVLLTAFGALVGWDAVKTRDDLNKARQENKDLTQRVVSFKKDATDLAFQNVDLKHYANDAQMLARSMAYYPDMSDFIGSLDEKDQEKAEKEIEALNAQKEAEHKKALKTLGVDVNLLYRVQQGPKIID